MKTLFLLLACCGAALAAEQQNLAQHINDAMDGTPQTREAVLDNRIWGDERPAQYWQTGASVPLADIPTLWREACWYGRAKAWWVGEDNCFYILEEPAWCGLPVFKLHVYACGEGEVSVFLPVASFVLKGLKDDGLAAGDVRTEGGKVTFSRAGYAPIVVDVSQQPSLRSIPLVYLYFVGVRALQDAPSPAPSCTCPPPRARAMRLRRWSDFSPTPLPPRLPAGRGRQAVGETSPLRVGTTLHEAAFQAHPRWGHA